MNKGLETLEIIKHTTDLDRPNELNGYADEIAIIEKELKALEIIKNKKVNVNLVYMFSSVDKYNDWLGRGTNWNGRLLTKEEYDLLKEILNDK